MKAPELAPLFSSLTDKRVFIFPILLGLRLRHDYAKSSAPGLGELMVQVVWSHIEIDPSCSTSGKLKNRKSARHNQSNGRQPGHPTKRTNLNMSNDLVVQLGAKLEHMLRRILGGETCNQLAQVNHCVVDNVPRSVLRSATEFYKHQ
ncbi:MAG: hypothetical protein JWP25_7400 [Bradyrhizobium sp.]|nr:hypothetical protein [Bradyrhizobium sp.]